VRAGLAADGGTLFDEVGEIPLDLQGSCGCFG
jgi:transcriptional regulator with GAF, ATPase, and Fis domain